MIPNKQFSLGVEDNKVKIYFVKKKGGPEIRRTIKSVEDFAKFITAKAEEAKCKVDDLIIMCSSSMDFPEDSTKDPDVIKLAHALR